MHLHLHFERSEDRVLGTVASCPLHQFYQNSSPEAPIIPTNPASRNNSSSPSIVRRISAPQLYQPLKVLVLEVILTLGKLKKEGDFPLLVAPVQVDFSDRPDHPSVSF